MPVVLVLGATSTIARAICAEFAGRGNDVVLAGRDCGELEAQAVDLAIRYSVRTNVQLFDAFDFESHSASFEQCLSELGETLEGAIWCVGHLGDQSAAEADSREARRILEINFTGCVLALESIARRLEARGRGFICALSSVAGDRGRRSNYFYGAAKAGLNAYLEGLRSRLHHSGVHVITIKPGFIDTRMTFGRSNVFLAASPESLARRTYRAVVNHDEIVYFPWFWRWIMLAIRSVPERVFKRLRL